MFHFYRMLNYMDLSFNIVKSKQMLILGEYFIWQLNRINQNLYHALRKNFFNKKVNFYIHLVDH